MVGAKQQQRYLLKSAGKTKIVATLEPYNEDYSQIEAMVGSIIDGIRLDLTVGNNQLRAKQVDWINKAAKKQGKNLAIIMDLPGLDVRLGNFDGVIEVKKGQTIVLAENADYVQTGIIPLMKDLSPLVKRGERLLMFDGRVKAVVNSVKDGAVFAEAVSDGILIKYKNIVLPDSRLRERLVTPEDKRALLFASTMNIDFVTLNLTRSADDVNQFKRLLSSMNFRCGVIAKIQDKAGINNLEEITQTADMVMFSPEALITGSTVRFEKLPLLQQEVILTGQRYATPTIISTRMFVGLGSDLEAARGESAMVASAVMSGCDSILLNDVAASGNQPLEAIKTIGRIVDYYAKKPLSERPADVRSLLVHGEKARTDVMASGIIGLAKSLKADIVIMAKTPEAAINLAAQREEGVRLIAVANSSACVNRLKLVYGVEPYLKPPATNNDFKLNELLLSKQLVAPGELIVEVSSESPGVIGPLDTLKIREVN
jgi:pyruvate kinase